MTVEIKGNNYKLTITKTEMERLRSFFPQKVFDCIVAAEASPDQIADIQEV